MASTRSLSLPLQAFLAAAEVSARTTPLEKIDELRTINAARHVLIDVQVMLSAFDRTVGEYPQGENYIVMFGRSIETELRFTHNTGLLTASPGTGSPLYRLNNEPIFHVRMHPVPDGSGIGFYLSRAEPVSDLTQKPFMKFGYGDNHFPDDTVIELYRSIGTMVGPNYPKVQAANHLSS